MTIFQAKLLEDKEAQWCIVRNMHKKFWSVRHKEMILSKVKAHTHYNWVCLRGQIKAYGMIDLAITNDQSTIGGPGWKLEDFQKRRDQGRITLKLWRISLDELSDKDREADRITTYIIIDELKGMGYEPILAHEYYKSYYSN